MRKYLYLSAVCVCMALCLVGRGSRQRYAVERRGDGGKPRKPVDSKR